MNIKRLNNQGFTLAEILVALAMSAVVLGSMFYAFKSQQDSYLVQSQVTNMQQNLRGAMYVVSRDLQMAGYCTSLDSKRYEATDNIDWDPTVAGIEETYPVIYGRNNAAAGDVDVRVGTDVLVVIKASNTAGDFRELVAADSVGVNSITLSPFDIDFTAGGNKFGVLMKNDLSRAEIFEITSVGGSTLSLKNNLEDDYDTGDWIYRADVIIYKIDEDTDSPGLRRRNLGADAGFELLAENIENLQVRYQLADGTWVDSVGDGAGNEDDVRAVEVALVARTAHTIRDWTDSSNFEQGDGTTIPTATDGYRRKMLCTVVETRNIGL